MLNLIADAYPKTSMEVLALPLLLCAVAYGLWYLGIALENRLEIKHVKWSAVLPLLVGLYFGIVNVQHVTDPWYSSIVDGDRIVMAHWISLFLPFIAAAGLGAWFMVAKRRAPVGEF